MNRHRLIVAAAALLAVTAGGPALAGECPAASVVAPGAGQAAGATAPSGVVDTVLAATDLAGEPVGIGDRTFRLRRLVIQPGGEVPWHSHDDRPAIIYVVSGEVTEYASTCAAPIVHRAGEATPERHGTSHWWRNTGSAPAVLLSADLLRSAADHKVM